MDFGEIYTPKNCHQVMRVCHAILRNPDDAEDAMQETFLNAHQALQQFRQGCQVSTWLISIARNACINQLRRRPDVEIVSLSAPVSQAAEDVFTIGDLIPAPGLSPETLVFIREIMELVEALCPAWRETLLLTLQGYQMKEIGATMMVSAVLIKGRLFRARQKMKLLASGKPRRRRQ